MSEDKKEKKEEKKSYSRKKKSDFDVKKKLAEIEKSKLPKSEKERYAAMLQENEDKKSGVPFSVYANARNLKRGELAGKEALAKAKGKESLTLKEWDEFFKKF